MSDVCNNCKNCGNAILEMPMGNYKCYVKKRSCTRQEIDIGGCGDWSEKRTVPKKPESGGKGANGELKTTKL